MNQLKDNSEMKPLEYAKYWNDNGAECLVCEKVTRVGCGMFTPFNSQKYGAKKGKQRVLFYPICEPCMEKKGTQDIAESKITMGLFSQGDHDATEN